MEILKGLKEQTVDHLSTLGGPEMDLMAVFTTGRQMEAIMECHSHRYLGSKYVEERCELLERLSCAYQGRHRTDLVDIGKSGTNGFEGFGSDVGME